MTGRIATAAGMLGALAFFAAFSGVRAETSQSPGFQDLNSQNPNAIGAAATMSARKSLQWGADGRWTLKLDMDQPVGREMGLKDVSAGAFFHITPSLRVGGSVDLGDKFAQPDKIVTQDTINAPRVHLETKFKF